MFDAGITALDIGITVIVTFCGGFFFGAAAVYLLIRKEDRTR